MKSTIQSLSLMALLVGAMSGCGGGGGGGYGGEGNVPAPGANPPSPPPSAPAPAASVGFTAWSKQMQTGGERDAPWPLENVTFSFDGDQDPAAYDDIMPPAT